MDKTQNSQPRLETRDGYQTKSRGSNDQEMGELRAATTKAKGG